MDSQTELERALTLIDDLVMLLDDFYIVLSNYGLTDKENKLVDEAEDFLRKHKRIP